ncbi:MAG: GAF domain-containing protein, partial [Chloroflexota bacterium]|nr:GAF domain-containing protein [Chloroflexota bacterium]
NLLRQCIDKSLAPSHLHIFLHDSLSEYYLATKDERGQPTTDLRFAFNSVLPQTLSRSKSFLTLGSNKELPAALQPEKARIALLEAQILAPLMGRGHQLLGFMTLSWRQSGNPYTNQDLDFLSGLSKQAAITIERAQIVADLERRVNEMNTLMRVTQGINVTPRLDDILELVYAQTNNIIPIRDFWVLLHNAEYDTYKYAFYLENDLRMLEHENISVEKGQGLAQEIVHTRQPIITNNYEKACRGRGLFPMVEKLYAWMGVPLNAGADTIGSLSLASRDPSTTYSNEDINLLQSIADQAAGAIVKTQLLNETERRARQLSLLNEISRNLTSTLDLSYLLNQILESAVDIINCEAGTLFLVDEESNDLIFEVVTGPVAADLIGKRLPAGSGHAGKAAMSGKSAIINDVSNTTKWAQEPDQQTGFQTQAMLLVPMIVQDRTIGIIEVINRRDGFPFSADDKSLLTAFASQAAVALENTRLYTLTDQQLADRVDELSVMQRIDRELNASLDIQRAMRITLDWAMRQSGADAGLVGSIKDDGVEIVADQGYTHELDAYRESLLPLERIPELRTSVGEASTRIFKRSQIAKNEHQHNLLQGMQTQIIYPIRREEQVIGVLMLESRNEDPLAADTQEFISRLSDHAAIAIANAQLFNQVREADVAKSEFVSFIAHELKNPMTSIRGYTDLLLKGAMGEVSEGQEDFLRTIRSNVNRMTKLVSDLADISRIEAGRLRLDFKAIDIAEIVDEVVRAQRNNLDQKSQSLVLQIPDELPAVWGDRTRLVQVLINLVSNANKYTPTDGKITIRAEDSAEVVRISVEDNGIGLSPEDQAQIFTKFFRSEDPKTSTAPGTGLGLNITRNLVEMQGGEIWFDSEYEMGTTFYFSIPIAHI